MARTEIKYDDYKIKAFLDTNIILECRPLAELPWQEIDADGPIIALVTSTTIKEIDSKKQDGRIGKRAREFNRLIASVAAGGSPIVIREISPRVELALSRSARIPWEELDELYPEDGDSCIVAEALHAKDMSSAGKLIVSHDIKPIAFASNYDLSTLHVSDNWLRQPEPHPKDREIQKLNSQLAQYKALEPDFEIDIQLLDPEPVPLFYIEDLSYEEQASIHSRICELNPYVDQERSLNNIFSTFDTYDPTYDKRFEAYQRRIERFMVGYSEKLERLFNQARFKLKVINTSNVQAENFLVNVCVSEGWLHDRFVFVSPQGPNRPIPRTTPRISIPSLPVISPRVGRHEFEFKEVPDYGKSFSVTCQDFRHAQQYIFEGIVNMDARASEIVEIYVDVTASNFRGTASKTKVIQTLIKRFHVSELLDLNDLKITVPLPMQELLDTDDMHSFEWKDFVE